MRDMKRFARAFFGSFANYMAILLLSHEQCDRSTTRTENRDTSILLRQAF